MRVLFLSSVYPRPYTQTLGVYCRALCDALTLRHEVHVISPVGWLERLRHGGPANGTGRLPTEFPTYYYPPKILRSTYGWCMWQSIRRNACRVIEKFVPDCVVSYWLHPDGEAAVRVARSAGIPSAVIVGGSDARLLPKEPRRRRSVIRVLNEADALITVSEGLKNSLLELGTCPSKVHVIYQGIDRVKFNAGDRGSSRACVGVSEGSKALLWVGSMVPVKGLDVLLDACSRVVPIVPAVHLYLVGDGPLRKWLISRVASLGISKNVTFVGPIPYEQLPNWYRAADLTVLSSWSEGIPNVLRESLACGTPFVSTRVGDVEEFCPGAANELVPPGDPSALASAIGRILAGGCLAPTMSRPDSWAESADKLAEVLEDLVSSKIASGRRGLGLELKV